MYETRKHPLLPRVLFLQRLALHFVCAAGLLFSSIYFGMVGYSYFENLNWRDGFLNSAMLLSGMGPVDMPKTDGGKVFAGLYALYAGLLFIVVSGLVFAPILHRLLHKFHWDEDE